MKTFIFSLILVFSTTAFSSEPIVRCFHLTWKPGTCQDGREKYVVYMSNNHPNHSFEGWVADTLKYFRNPEMTEVPELNTELACIDKASEIYKKGKAPRIYGVDSFLPDCIVPVK